jgi:hypothetical protein
MIIREWRCCARQADAAKYPDYFRKQLTPELRTMPGFLGATLSQRRSDTVRHYEVLEDLSPKKT